MSTMKNLTIDSVVTEQSEPPLIEAMPIVVRRTFNIDSPNDNGEISVSEVAGFNEVQICVKNNHRKAQINLSYEGFKELSHLLYVVNCNRPSNRPF